MEIESGMLQLVQFQRFLSENIFAENSADRNIVHEFFFVQSRMTSRESVKREHKAWLFLVAVSFYLTSFF